MKDLEPSKRRQGFATMSREQHQAVTRKGGLASKPEQRTFSTNRKVAQLAGFKGGQVTGNPAGPKPRPKPDPNPNPNPQEPT